jgi:hypothetical protein
VAWTHFTTLLAPGDVLTKDQRDELLDALEERVIASGRSYHADMVDVRASEIANRGIRLTDSLYEWDSVLLALAPNYFEDTSAATKYTPTSFRAAIASALGGGLTGSDINSLFTTGSGIPAAGFWNAIREGIRLLVAPELANSLVTTTGYRKNASAGTWAAASAAFLSATESVASLVPIIQASESSFSTSYTVFGRRSRIAVDVPAASCFSNGYEAWVFASQGTAIGAMPTITIRVKHSGSDHDVTPASGGAYSRVTLAGLAATGSAALTLDVLARAYEDATELNTLQPALNSSWSRTPGFIYAVKPTFTHP